MYWPAKKCQCSWWQGRTIQSPCSASVCKVKSINQARPESEQPHCRLMNTRTKVPMFQQDSKTLGKIDQTAAADSKYRSSPQQPFSHRDCAICCNLHSHWFRQQAGALQKRSTSVSKSTMNFLRVRQAVLFEQWNNMTTVSFPDMSIDELISKSLCGFIKHRMV